MDELWTTLGLEATKDVSAIKRAYAERAKTCHPEEDSDGFMKLRQAYQAALAYAEGREEAASPPTAPEAAEPEDDFDVTRHKKFVVKPMSVEEAMLQMDLLGHQFFFFRNADNDNVHAVVYKRANGGYGLIESE